MNHDDIQGEFSSCRHTTSYGETRKTNILVWQIQRLQIITLKNSSWDVDQFSNLVQSSKWNGILLLSLEIKTTELHKLMIQILSTSGKPLFRIINALYRDQLKSSENDKLSIYFCVDKVTIEKKNRILYFCTSAKYLQDSRRICSNTDRFWKILHLYVSELDDLYHVTWWEYNLLRSFVNSVSKNWICEMYRKRWKKKTRNVKDRKQNWVSIPRRIIVVDKNVQRSW